MKSLSHVLHRTPWWALFVGGLVVFVVLVGMVTPIHLIGLEHAGTSPGEKRAIKKEIESTFSQGAIDMARSVVLEMRERARDPAQRDELDRALAEIERARSRVGEAGEATRQARTAAAEAAREARKAVEEAARRPPGPAQPPPPAGKGERS